MNCLKYEYIKIAEVKFEKKNFSFKTMSQKLFCHIHIFANERNNSAADILFAPKDV